MGAIEPDLPKSVSRRDFLKIFGVAAGNLLLFPNILKLLRFLRPERPTLVKFSNMKEALDFLHGTEGVNWRPGKALDEIEYFPWRDTDAWNIDFRNLQTWGYDYHQAYLVPNRENEKYGIIGVETINDIDPYTVLDFVGAEGKSKAVRVEGRPDLKTLLGKDHAYLSNRSPFVYKDIPVQGGPRKDSILHPIPGVTHGSIYTTDGLWEKYFKGSGKY